MTSYLDDLFKLSGKVAAVVGGGGHLCSEIARGFSRAGCNVAVLDLRLKKAQNVVDELKENGPTQALALQFDASDRVQQESALAAVLATFGRVDILVNGAGINSPIPFLDLTLDDWRAVLDSQLTSTFLGCQVFGRRMVEQGGGSIINISSASAGPPLSKAFAYSAAKAAVKNLTQNLGREWAQAGVRVNALRPGFFPTEWNRKNFITPDRERAILGHTPMARYGEPHELIGATLWLASDASKFVTGSEVAVDGGFSCMTI